MIYGYARVSTKGQQKNGNSLEEQTQEIKRRYENAVIVTEAYSGAKERPVFSELLDRVNCGDTLVITKLDRFCRSVKQGLDYIDKLIKKGVKIHILNMGLIEDTPMGRLIVTNLLAFAEFERAMISERTAGGKAVKKANDPDYREGRPKKNIEGFEDMRSLVSRGELSVTAAAKSLGISRRTWYNLAREAAV
ncbi:MAG: recombinase family protein [Porcipelethomonas sp.]